MAFVGVGAANDCTTKIENNGVGCRAKLLPGGITLVARVDMNIQPDNILRFAVIVGRTANEHARRKHALEGNR